MAIIYTNSFRFTPHALDPVLSLPNTNAMIRWPGRFAGGYALGTSAGGNTARSIEIATNPSANVGNLSLGFAHYTATSSRVFIIGRATATDTITCPYAGPTVCAAYTSTSAWVINDPTPVPNGWQWFCLQVLPNVSTGGHMRLYVNGSLVATKGPDTIGSQGYLTGFNISLGSATSDPNQYQAIGDLVISDDPNYLIPDSRVDMLLPTADVGTVWTPSTGTTLFPLVADSGGPTVNADYISSGTVGAHQQFDLENLPHSPSTVRAVATVGSTAKSDSGPRTMAVTLNGVDGPALDSGLQDWRRKVYETNPSGGAAWSAADVNAARVGVKVVT